MLLDILAAIARKYHEDRRRVCLCSPAERWGAFLFVCRFDQTETAPLPTPFCGYCAWTGPL